MLPSPAMNAWSMSNGLSFVVRESNSSRNFTHGMGSSTGSMPSDASSGTSFVNSSGAVMNTSPNVRGSTKRNCPPCVNVMTTCVCLTTSSFACARSSWPLMRRWNTSSSPVSSFSTRYFPRRSTPVIFAPSSLVTNCFFVWRRTVRVPVTCAVFTRLPTTSRSRPRRIVSTSGSSGIGARVDRHRAVRDGLRLAHGVELLPQSLPRRSRGRRFRLLLRPALAPPPQLAVHAHLRVEPLRVIRTLVAHRVPRQLGEVPSHELLQARLVVLTARTFARLADAVTEQVEHEPLRGRPPSREVDGAEHRFQRVGEDRRLLAPTRARLALPEEQRLTELQLACDLGQRGRAHDRRPHLGELALGQGRVGAVDVVGHDEAEDGVAEELEAFVRFVSGML